MNFSFLILQRALLALCIILFVSCSSSHCRQWELQKIDTNIACFEGGRLLLEPDSDYSYLELEMVRSQMEVRLYINLLFLQALPHPEDSSRTTIEIIFDDEEPWTIYPYLLKGGQRLLLPAEITDYLILKLLDDQSFIIRIGRNQTQVITDNFPEVYQKLLNIKIEENLSLDDKAILLNE